MLLYRSTSIGFYNYVESVLTVARNSLSEIATFTSTNLQSSFNYRLFVSERPYTLTMKGAVLLLLVAVLVRLLLLWQRSHEWLGQRIEISTPINQWKRSESEVYAYMQVVISRDLHTHHFFVGSGSQHKPFMLNFWFTRCSKGRNSTLRRRTLTLRRGHIS